MQKRKVKIDEIAGKIVSELPKGILLTTKTEDKVNTMTIGWGTVGIEWGKPVFAAYIREGRFTRKQLDRNPVFTVNIPVERTPEVRKAVGFCGSHSGRTEDKISGAGLTLVESEAVAAPAVKEFPITLECQVVFKQRQELSEIDSKFENFYPQDVDSSATGANKDAHIAYYGEIVDAYIIED
ncbi:flavin reductase family protein [Pseudoramibacter sp.]|jgi:flavin reductase (DIM6/NTAB) family NADH-FMN oxidoreductase RutF|uniref:flavin reductase family protein n=1 Tax=Pseudoramibacter sp. TaxID=2034862 RepID=UPI0025F996C4|nr:flavin reductase family protein [Pseudoramibacter sp.]MCH4072247.1 flavin reductase family protein [Pseudoramibacter sp.]MCH4106017.1 flavin reductase family protein [Pseudoramibacter sp.]